MRTSTRKAFVSHATWKHNEFTAHHVDKSHRHHKRTSTSSSSSRMPPPPPPQPASQLITPVPITNTSRRLSARPACSGETWDTIPLLHPDLCEDWDGRSMETRTSCHVCCNELSCCICMSSLFDRVFFFFSPQLPWLAICMFLT